MDRSTDEPGPDPHELPDAESPRRHFSEPELVELDRLAPEILTRGLPARLADDVDALLAADLEAHPWALLLAAAICHDVHRGDPRAMAMFDQAWCRFEQMGDPEALGIAANVGANIALGHGDIPEAVAWWRRAGTHLGEGGDLAISAVAHTSLEAYASGDLAEAERRARAALLLADASGQEADAVTPMIYLALYAFCQGDLQRSARLLARAEGICEAEESHNETALVLGFAAAIHALRGNQAEADRGFAAALERAELDHAPWYGAMVRALRADYAARWAPHRSLVDARRAQEETAALGDTWWHGLARYAEGAALAELGRLEEARCVLEGAVQELTNPVERGFAQLELGEVLLGLGERRCARVVLEEAREGFESSGARYWATRASLALGAAYRDRGGRSLRLARTTAVEDPAYDRLFAPSHDLTINVLGSPSVLLDGERVEFLTRHAELATYLLAMAGPGGLPAAELTETLWPGVDEERSRSRLRTLLWQVRNALGREAWRVQRDPARSGVLVLDLTGVDVDWHRRTMLAEERAAEGLVGLGARIGSADPAGPPTGGPAIAGPPAVGTGELLEGWDVTLPPSLQHLTVATG